MLLAYSPKAQEGLANWESYKMRVSECGRAKAQHEPTLTSARAVFRA